MMDDREGQGKRLEAACVQTIFNPLLNVWRKKLTLLIVQQEIRKLETIWTEVHSSCIPGSNSIWATSYLTKSPSHFNLCCCKRWSTTVFRLRGVMGLRPARSHFLATATLIGLRKGSLLAVSDSILNITATTSREKSWPA